MNKNYSFKGILASFLMMLVAVSASAQSRITVTGTVTDGRDPLIGVTVVVSNASTSIGTTTGADGRYSINVPDANAVLTVSYLGFKSQSATVGTQRVIDFVLAEDAIQAEEVVVIGYGTQTKSHLTGSISKIDGALFADRPISDVTTALQGQIPGLTIDNTTSEVGVSPKIRVRGLGSVSADSEPLVVVDGFPIPGGLQMVNPADIQSVEILKDAASAAIYGSRAANGVIIVTTKEGTVDRPKYTVKASTGIKYAYQLHDMMNSQEYLELMQWQESVGGPGPNAQVRAAAWLEENIGYTDWQREGLRDLAMITNVQFSVSGGGKNESKHYTSGAYTKDDGLALGNEVQKINFRTKHDTKLSKIITFGTNISGTYQKSSRPRNNFIDFYRTPTFMPVVHNERSTALTGWTGYARGSHFNPVLTPTGAVDDFGNPTWESSSPYSSQNPNPRSIMNNTWRDYEYFQSVGSMYLAIDIAKGLQFRSSNGYNIRFNENTTYSNFDAVKDNDPSTGSFYSSSYVDLLTENTLNYNLKLSKHTFSFLAGFTLQNTRRNYAEMTGTKFPSDDIHTLNAANEFNPELANTYRYPNTVLESYLARVNYDYDNKYLLSAVVRLDRSSLFTKGNRGGWFPSLSLGWRVSEEDFMKPIYWLNSLKVRASYGVTGNNNIPADAVFDALSTANYVLGSGRGSLQGGLANTSSTLGNPLVSWEQTDEFNLGLDISVLDSRINLTVDAYYSVTRALLLRQQMQSFTGFNNSWNNIGKIRNQGLEILLDTYNIINKNFTWTTSLNFAMNRNKLLDWGGEERVITLGERDEGYISIVGKPLIQYYGYKSLGVWNNTQEIADNPSNPTDVPGGLRIWDADGGGTIGPEDMVPLGDPYPDFTWGMTNIFKIQNFDISFLIQGVQGITVFNGDIFYNETHKWNKAYANTDRWVSDAHRGDGKTPYAKTGINILLTDLPLQDASYLCLRNFTVGYTFSSSSLKKVGLRALRLYVAGNNLFYLWTKGYKGINPESRITSGTYADPLIDGYQRGGFPLTSTVTFGVDLNF